MGDWKNWMKRGVILLGVGLGLVLMANQGVAHSVPSRLSAEVVPTTIKDENGQTVRLMAPGSLKSDAAARRLYGTPSGVGGLFETLYHGKRRQASYQAAIRELSMQPDAHRSSAAWLRTQLDRAGVAADDAQFVMNLVEQGADALNKQYVAGDTLTAAERNRLADVANKLERVRGGTAFATVGLALQDFQATRELCNTITGALLIQALASDQARERIELIDRAATAEWRAVGAVDPALVAAIKEVRIEWDAGRSGIGAFAVHVNNNLRDITEAAVDLGAGLAAKAAHFSAPFALWVGAPLMTYKTLRNVSDNWELGQDAVMIATLTRMLEERAETGALRDGMVAYGEYAFHSNMEDVFSATGFRVRDFVTPDSVGRDMRAHHRERKNAALGQIVREQESDIATRPVAPTPSRPERPREAISGGPVRGQNWTSPSTGMEFVWIPTMNLWVGKYEVTNAEYRRKKPEHNSGEVRGHSLNGDGQPVVQISITDVRRFLAWQTRQDGLAAHGLGYRIPCEREWVQFARCGSRRLFPWGNQWPPVSGRGGNYADERAFRAVDLHPESFIRGYDDGWAVTAPVRDLPANPWGLYGVGGNVSELCVSAARRGPGSYTPQGGNWRSYERTHIELGLNTAQDVFMGAGRSDIYGFRLVMDRLRQEDLSSPPPEPAPAPSARQVPESPPLPAAVAGTPRIIRNKSPQYNLGHPLEWYGDDVLIAGVSVIAINVDETTVFVLRGREFPSKQARYSFGLADGQVKLLLDGKVSWRLLQRGMNEFYLLNKSSDQRSNSAYVEIR